MNQPNDKVEPLTRDQIAAAVRDAPKNSRGWYELHIDEEERDYLLSLLSAAREQEGYPGIAHDFERDRSVLMGVSNLLQRCLRHGLLRAEAEAMLLDIDAALKNAAPQGRKTVTGDCQGRNDPEGVSATDGDAPAVAAPAASERAIGPHEPPMVYDPMHGMVKPGVVRALMAELRQLYDKTAEAHDGDYADKVNHGLVAVYAYGQRKSAASASAPREAIAFILEHGLDDHWQACDPEAAAVRTIRAWLNSTDRTGA